MPVQSVLERPVVLAPRAVAIAPRKRNLFALAEQVILGVAGIFYALHFLHLRADFPNQSPWMDWAKYTDEGWYGDAAIRHYIWGHWNVPGDFNPAAALPVWPLLEMAVFKVTGVSLVAARVLTVGVFGLILLASYGLLRRWRAGKKSLAPALAVLLLSTSPFCYAFTRMAVLEPLLILLTLCGLLLAQGMRERDGGSRMARLRPLVLGAVLPLMVLTKTTGVFLFPAIFFLLWAGAERDWRKFARTAWVPCATGAALWGAYYGFFVRRHFLEDYEYLFSANTYTKITASTFWSVVSETFTDGTWIGEALYWSALIALAGWIIVGAVSRFRRGAVPVALALWVLGYAAFMAYHANLAPRYYLMLAVPLMLLLALGAEAVLRAAWTARRNSRAWMTGSAAVATALTLCFILVSDAQTTLGYVAHPEYTFLTAVHHMQDEIERQLKVDPHHSRLVLSISGSDISMITGLPSICDDFGTMELPDRVEAYRPGWFAAWNSVENDKMEALAPMYRVVRVGEYPAYDDPERNLLILYRLDPVSSPQRGRSGRRRYFVSPRRRPVRPARKHAVSATGVARPGGDQNR